MSFDPEKVERRTPDNIIFTKREYVLASDYDQLFRLYRELLEKYEMDR